MLIAMRSLVLLGVFLNGHVADAKALTGIMYEGWHAPAYWGRSPQLIESEITVEDIIRSDGTLTMANISSQLNGKDMGFWWHKKPIDGFYCIYRKRDSENVSSCGLPDCPNITQTLTRHAKLLTDAGIDFVVADSTNIQNTGATADAIQLRPWQVLAEEWLKLRQAGIKTPQIAIWQNLQEPNGNLWQQYTENEYSDPKYNDLIFFDQHTKKKVFFTTANPTSSLVTKIEATPNQNITVVTMWALRNNFNVGEWGFFSPCMSAATPTQRSTFTTSVYSDPTVKCNQSVTTNSKIGEHGTAITVGPSFQLSYSSLPFRAAGKLGGLTLRKQFERAMLENSKGTLDYMFVGTFNEHIAQPQHNPFPNFVTSMGLESDTMKLSLWVDAYGDGITRDLEPTAQDGGKMWEIFTSCKRVFDTGAPSCNNASEICCATPATAPETAWSNVYALVNTNAIPADHLLTVDSNEKRVLLSQGWSEVCSEVGGATAFCNWGGDPNANAPNASAYTGGPFLMHSSPLQPNNASTAVYRCIAPTGQHFISATSDCDGGGKAEFVLGYSSTTRSSNHPRSLRNCEDTATYRHSLDAVCAATEKSQFLGFVH